MRATLEREWPFLICPANALNTNHPDTISRNWRLLAMNLQGIQPSYIIHCSGDVQKFFSPIGFNPEFALLQNRLIPIRLLREIATWRSNTRVKSFLCLNDPAVKGKRIKMWEASFFKKKSVNSSPWWRAYLQPFSRLEYSFPGCRKFSTLKLSPISTHARAYNWLFDLNIRK